MQRGDFGALCLTALWTLFKPSRLPTISSPPKRGAHIFRRERWESRFYLPSSSSRTPIPTGREDGEEERGGDDEDAHDFAFPFPYSICMFSIRLFFSPYGIFISITLYLSLGRVSVEYEKDLICWQITDWLNIYKTGYYCLLTLHGMKEIAS